MHEAVSCRQPHAVIRPWVHGVSAAGIAITMAMMPVTSGRPGSTGRIDGTGRHADSSSCADPARRTCGECISFRRSRQLAWEIPGAGRCRAEAPNRYWAVLPHWEPSGLFKSPWQADRERLEQSGQLRIEFHNQEGVALV